MKATRSKSIGPQKKFCVETFRAESPRKGITVGQIIPFINDTENFERAVREDIKRLQGQQQIITGEQRKIKEDIDNRVSAIEAKIQELFQELKDIKSGNMDTQAKEGPSIAVNTGNDIEETNAEEIYDDSDLNVLGSDLFGHGLRITPYTGEGDVTFSSWLRKFQDYADAQGKPWTDRQKAQKLKFFLDGLPREEYESLTEEEKGDFSQAVAKLREIFESPKMRNLARQKLMNCKQKDGEPVTTYAERIRRAVKAATVGLSEQTFKETLMDHFIAGLSSKTRFFVQNAEPNTFEQALLKAQHVESLLGTETDSVQALMNAFSATEMLNKSSHSRDVANLGIAINELKEIKNELREINNSNSRLSRQEDRCDRAGNTAYPTAPQGRRSPQGEYTRRSPYYDNKVVQQGHRYERHFDTRPFCTFCKKLGHLAYNCYHRQPPPTNIRPLQAQPTFGYNGPPRRDYEHFENSRRGQQTGYNQTDRQTQPMRYGGRSIRGKVGAPVNAMGRTRNTRVPSGTIENNSNRERYTSQVHDQGYDFPEVDGLDMRSLQGRLRSGVEEDKLEFQCLVMEHEKVPISEITKEEASPNQTEFMRDTNQRSSDDDELYKTTDPNKVAGSDSNSSYTSQALSDCATVTSINPNRPTSLTTIKGTVNSISFTFLIDTGAALTVGSADLLDPLGARLVMESTRATGVSGHPLHILGFARVEIAIGAHRAGAKMYFTENPSLRPGKKDYDIIIGCDVLKLFPPFKLDIQNGWLCMRNERLPLNANTVSQPAVAPVRVMGNVEIPVHAEKFVRCMLDVNIKPGTKAFVVEEPSYAFTEKDLFLTPAVVKPVKGNIFLLVSNATNEPKFLFDRMCLAHAYHLEENEGLLEISECGDVNNLCEHPNPIPDPSFCINFDECQVNELELRHLKSLTHEYSGVFSSNKFDLGSCSAVKHDIVTTTDSPVIVRPTKVPFQYRAELQKQINELVRCGVLKESKTNWVANLVLVQKKDGGLRMCVDFRKLNAVTVQEIFPLPRLETVLERIGGCEYYSSLDLSQGFLQIKVSENMSNKLGVVVEDKCYQYTHLPFGLKNATSIFCRTMSKVFAGLSEGVCFYVDDILVYTKSRDFNEHLELLRSVFERLSQFNLKLSPKKCHFAQKSIVFLGHNISKQGYRPSVANLESIENFPIPQSVTEIRRFCGLAGFYRKFIPEFAKLSAPLTELTKKYQRFVWGPKQQQSFDRIKSLLLQEPILSYPNYDKDFHVFTDCSAVAQAGALMQQVKSGSGMYYAICYCSRTLTESERKWPIIQAELATIVYALRAFKPFIFMSKCIVHCDHKPLSYVLKKSEAHPNLARWIIELQTYNITIHFIKGTQNKVADALSRVKPDRIAAPRNEEIEDIIDFPNCLTYERNNEIDNIVSIPAVDKFIVKDLSNENYVTDLVREQKSDLDLMPIINFLENGEIPPDMSAIEIEKFVDRCKKYALDQAGCLRYCPSGQPNKASISRATVTEFPVVVPKSLQSLIFDYFHLSPLAGGHLNFRKVLHKSKKYYWEGKYSDIYRWTKACLTCQMRNNPRPYPREPLTPVSNAAVMNQIGLDLCGPFPTTEKGNKYIMNVVCMFSKYVISIPVEDSRSNTLAKSLLNNCVLIYGAPNILNTDNATAFSSSFFQEFCNLLYINKRYSIPYYSAGNGAVERTFRTYQNMLAKYTSEKSTEFDEFLPFMSFCYNTSVNEMTGESPYFLMFGRDPRFSIEDIIRVDSRGSYSEQDVDIYKRDLIQSLKRAWHLAYEYSLKAQAKMKKYYDQRSANSNIQIGDRVLLLRKQIKPGNLKKFHLPWTGIYRVIEIHHPAAIIVSCSVPHATPFKVHLNQLKKYISLEGPACNLPVLPEGERNALNDCGAVPQEVIPGYLYDIPEDSDGTTERNLEQQNTVKTHTYNLRSQQKK